MASTVRIHNGKGARTIGKATRTRNEGKAAESFGFFAGALGYVTLQVGEHVDAHTREQKKAINSGLLAAGWIAHTHHDAREHPEGASIEIERNFWDDMDTLPDGWTQGDPTKVKVVARFIRSS
jgi:hypothetical protein